MGLWNSIFGGGGRPSKNDLLRSLVKQRIRQDPMASSMGFNENMVDSLGMLQLAGLPENTIATIVSTYATLKKHDTSDQEIFSRIEGHRSSIGAGEMPNPLNLNTYIQYRIDIEHSDGAPISDDSVAASVRACCEHYSC